MTPSAESIVKALVHGRQAERMEAQRLLGAEAKAFDPGLVRDLILEALKGPCAPCDQADDTHGGARCWLVSSLGLVPADGDEPEAAILSFLDPKKEWSWWVRYWAVQALLERGSGKLLQACRDTVIKDADPLPRSLGVAVLAKAGEGKYVQELKESLGDGRGTREAEGNRWAVLRALRFVFLPFAVETVASIVHDAARNKTFSDVTFDAIVALGNVPSDAPEAQVAANALITIITRAREFQYWDVMRIRAIEGLGKLRVGHTASLLLDEVTDLNPSVVKEAVLALERVLDAEAMTTRILERLAKDPNREALFPQYAAALRFLTDTKPAVNRLESAMLSGPIETREHARRLLSEVGGSYVMDKLAAQTRGAERYLDVLGKSDVRLNELFEKTIEEARRGFRIVTRMDVTLFVVGLGLLGLAMGMAVAQHEVIGTLTASGGVLSVLYGRFFAKPREQVEASVTHLASLKTIFLGYLRQLHQIDQSYVRRMLDEKAPDAKETEEYTKLVKSVMASALKQLGTHQAIRRAGSGEGGEDEETDNVKPISGAQRGEGQPKPKDGAGAATG